MELVEQATPSEPLQHTQRECTAADTAARETQGRPRGLMQLPEDRFHAESIHALQPIGVGVFEEPPIEAAQVVPVERDRHGARVNADVLAELITQPDAPGRLRLVKLWLSQQRVEDLR